MTETPTPTSAAQPGAVDTRLCPLCGQGNQCANEIERATGVPQEACWCTTASFSAELLERVPVAARRLACICARCAATSPQNPS